MRPKVNPDLFYISAPDGVHVRTGAKWFALPGASTAAWLDRLVPHLDGQRTLDELLAQVPEPKRAMVQQLVDLLVQHNCLRDTSADQPHGLTPQEQQLYAAEIAFLDAFGSSAAHRFERFRTSRVLLVGAGLTLTALVHACLRIGLRRVAVLTTDECSTESRRFGDYLALFRDRDPAQDLLLLDGGDPVALMAQYDALLHISDRPMGDRAQRLQLAGRRQNVRVLQALLDYGQAWIGPEGAGCWECAWRRLQERPQGRPLHDAPEAPSEPFLGPITAGMIANLLSFELFRALGKAGPPERSERMLRLDLETLQTDEAFYRPHPTCGSCGPSEPEDEVLFHATVKALIAAPATSGEQFRRVVVTAIDPWLGLIRDIDEHDFEQLPLNVVAVDRADPTGQATAESLRVLAVGPELGVARERAVRRALEDYALGLVDRSRLLPGDTANDQSAIWGLDLQSGASLRVPAPEVYPALRSAGCGQEQPGVGSGLCWAEATARALLGHARAWAIAVGQEPRQSLRPLARGDWTPTALAARYSTLVDMFGTELRIFDLTAEAGLPAFAFQLGTRTVAYTADLDAAAALTDGLEQVVWYQQSRVAGQAEIEPRAVPQLRGVPTTAPVALERSPAPEGWQAYQQALLARVAARGWRATAVPLQHQGALTAALPLVVVVMLTRAREGR